MLTPNASCTLYLQTGPYQYRRIFCPSVFWQEDADGTSVIIPEDLPEQYKGEKREHDFIIRGERTGEVTDTESKKSAACRQASDRQKPCTLFVRRPASL